MGYYSTTLQKGSKGDEVKKWQEFLNTQGYGLSVDGDFGNNTYNATVAYQKANGLSQDGIVGKNTWGKAGFNSSPSSKDFEYDDFTYDDFNYNDYTESDVVKNAGTALDTHLANKPGEYQSKWQSNIDALMDKILNREEFSYDLNSDALYNQYKDQYMQQGKIAMEDTMGQAAALTGGYGNSYAATVGNQAYQAYLGKLNEVVPELYQMALDRYNREGQELYNQYGMFSDRENLDYGRYRDTVSDYLTERDYLAGRYDSERDYDYSKYIDGRDFDYGKYSSDRSLAYDEYSNDKNLAYQEYRNSIADEQWEKEFAENKRRYEESKVASSGGSGGSSGSGGSITEGYTQSPSSNFFDENGNFKQATFSRYDNNGNAVWYIGGKEVVRQAGANPYTGSVNPDAKNGTFSNGYQPNNVNGKKLSKSGITDSVNGVTQNVWQDTEGTLWIWDGTQNKYLYYGEQKKTTGTKTSSSSSRNNKVEHVLK